MKSLKLEDLPYCPTKGKTQTNLEQCKTCVEFGCIPNPITRSLVIPKSVVEARKAELNNEHANQLINSHLKYIFSSCEKYGGKSEGEVDRIIAEHNRLLCKGWPNHHIMWQITEIQRLLVMEE